VITDPIKKRKYALSHLFLIPKYAVLDASLLTSLPAKMTAYSGMDALTHAIEAYINCFNNRKTNEYALCAIKSIFQYLVPSFEDGLKLVAARANAMQKACEQNPGTMAAIIGLADEKVEDLLF